VNKKEATFEYYDVYQTKLHDGSTVHQHHQLRRRLREITKLDRGELHITLPKQVKIEPQVLLSPWQEVDCRSLLEFYRNQWSPLLLSLTRR